ncbi:MAG: PAS domain S-box protein [Saprospiraceae bacterium]|nr:PAS domain S-box protein [Saprospiraceae bacterium]
MQTDSVNIGTNLYKWVLENLSQGCLLFDRKLQIIEANSEVRSILGFGPHELVHRNLSEIVHESSYDSFERMMTSLSLVDSIGRDFAITLKSSDGQSIESTIQLTAPPPSLEMDLYMLTIKESQHLEAPSDFPNLNDKDWRQVILDSPMAMAIMDPLQFTFIDANRSAESMLGYSIDELRQINPMKISPEIQPCGTNTILKALNIIEQVFKGEKPFFEWEIIHKSAEARFLEICVDRFRINDHSVIIAIATDITLRKKQEIFLAESEARFRNFFDNNPLMIFAISEQGEVLSINQAVTEQLGYAEDDLLDQHVTQVFHPMDQSKVLKNIEASQQLDGNDFNQWELRKISKRGEIIWVREIIRAIDWPDGRKAYLISCENITARKQAEEEQRNAELQYRSIFENHLFGIFVINIKGEFTIANPSFCDMLGYTEEELLMMTWQDITAPEDQERCRSQVNPTLFENNQTLTIEKQYVHKLGYPISVRCFTKPIDLPPKESFLVIVEDITNEQELKEREAQLSIKQSEIDHKNRELTSSMLFMTQKNRLLAEIFEALSKIGVEANETAFEKIKRLQTYISKHTDREEDWKSFVKHFQEVNPNFLDTLSKKYPQLTQNELKHCAYVRLRLSNQDVASLLHISTKAVEIARYRIKKKLGLESRYDKLIDLLEHISNS